MKNIKIFAFLAIFLLSAFVSSAWAVDVTLTYKIDVQGTLKPVAKIYDATNRLVASWDHGIKTLWPANEGHSMNDGYGITFTPDQELDKTGKNENNESATTTAFRTEKTTFFTVSVGKEGFYLKSVTFKEDDVEKASSSNIAQNSTSISVRVPGDKFFNYITVVLTADAYTVSVPKNLTISDAFATINRVKYYKSGETVTLTAKENEIIENIAGVTASNVEVSVTVADDKRRATFKMPSENVEIFKIWGDGDGSENNPFTISRSLELDSLAKRVNAGNDYSGKYFKLTAEITYTYEGSEQENNYTATGDYDHPFKGKFNGNGHTIKGIRIYKPSDSYQGLFGYLGEGAEVENVKLVGVEITANSYVGGIAGFSGGSIRNCSVEEKVIIKSTVDDCSSFGGIVGYNEGTVSGCTSSASLTGPGDNHGGIVGSNSGGTVRGNFAKNVTVSAANYYGAVIGYDYDSKLENNFYTACTVNGVENASNVGVNGSDVTENNGAVGIFAVSLSEGLSITGPETPIYTDNDKNAYYKPGETVTLTATKVNEFIDGIVGVTASIADDRKSATFTMPSEDVAITADFLSTTEVHTVSVPENLTVSDVFMTIGEVHYCKPGETVTLTATRVNEVIDGIAGVTASIADDRKTATFTMPSEDVTITATTVEVHTVSVPENLTISDAFATIKGVNYCKPGETVTLTAKENIIIEKITGVTGSNVEVKFAIADDKRRATFKMPSENVEISATISKIWGGDGSKELPYTIASVSELDMFALIVNSGHDFKDTYFKVVDDITYTYEGSEQENNYTAIGNEKHPFNGKFNGNGHTISGIRIYKPNDSYQGLFGYLGKGAEVEKVKFADVEITAYRYAGGIAGVSDGSIRNCTVEKSVKLTSTADYAKYFGGIVGENSGTVSGCTSSATLTASGSNAAFYGGIVGENSGTVSGCTSSATLTASGSNAAFYGGIVGENFGTVSGCTSSATLTASGSNAAFYGGIVGDNYGGTVRDNFAKNVTVPAAYYYGAVVGRAFNSKFENNFYTACTVKGVENVTNVGVNGRDVTENNGAVGISFTEPAAVKNLVYNKSSQELVTAGETDFGKLLYSLDGENYGTEIPTATDAKTYTVYYRVDNDDKNMIPPQTIEVSIVPKTVLVSGAVQVFEDQNGSHAEIDGNYSGSDTVKILNPVDVDDVIINRSFTPKTPATIMLPVALPAGTTVNAEFYTLEKVEQVGMSWQATMKYIGDGKFPQPNTPYAVILPEGESKLEFNLNGNKAIVQTSDINKVCGIDVPCTLDEFGQIKNDWYFTGTYAYKAWNAGNEEIGLAYAFAATDNPDGASKGKFGKIVAGAFANPMRSYLRKRDANVKLVKPQQVAASYVNRYSVNYMPDPETINVNFVKDDAKDGRTVLHGRMNVRTGEFKMLRDYDLKGRKVNSTNRARGAYYGKKVLKK